MEEDKEMVGCGTSVLLFLTRSSAAPMRQMVMREGHHLLNSPTQLERVDLGAITTCGPGTSLIRTM